MRKDGAFRSLLGGADSFTALEAAYKASTYQVMLPEGEGALNVRIGEPNPALDAFLFRMGVCGGAFICAVNPASRILSKAENVDRHARLCRELATASLLYFEGEALADARDWPAEAGALVIGVSEAEIRDMGYRHGQNAVVWIARGEPPRLVWCLQGDCTLAALQKYHPKGLDRKY